VPAATPRGSALYLAVAGAGVAVLPRPVAQLGRSHGAEIASLRPRQTRPVYLLRRAAPLSPAARAIPALLEPAHPTPEAAIAQLFSVTPTASSSCRTCFPGSGLAEHYGIPRTWDTVISARVVEEAAC